MAEVKCKDCQSYEKIDNERGNCHFNAPAIPFKGLKINYTGDKFPEVLKSDWCSQYKENIA